MSADPLRRRVNDNICAVFNWPTEIPTGSKGVVNDQGNAVIVSNLRNRRDVWYVELWVSYCLDVESFCLTVDQLPKIVRVVTIDEFHVDSKPREGNLELIVRPAVQETCGDEGFSCLCNRGDCKKLCCLS